MIGTPSAAFHTGFTEEDEAEEQPLWAATVAFGRADAGLSSSALPGEPVSQWFHDGSAWVGTDTQLSNAAGQVAWSGPPVEPDLLARTVLLEADGSCGRQLSLRLPRDAPVVITDVDETLTLTDAEFFQQVADASYEPIARAGGPALFDAWVEQGVQPIYMTARPHLARTETRTWLEQQGFPDGPLITAEELVLGDATVAYKALWVERIVHGLGFDVVAAYGNSTSDIEAYLSLLPPERVYIIGEHAGEQGTVPVEEDWIEHLAEVQAR